MADCGVEISVEDYVDSFRPDLMQPVAQWCGGARFADVLKLADVFEVRFVCGVCVWLGVVVMAVGSGGGGGAHGCLDVCGLVDACVVRWVSRRLVG